MICETLFEQAYREGLNINSKISVYHNLKKLFFNFRIWLSQYDKLHFINFCDAPLPMDFDAFVVILLQILIHASMYIQSEFIYFHIICVDPRTTNLIGLFKCCHIISILKTMFGGTNTSWKCILLCKRLKCFHLFFAYLNQLQQQQFSCFSTLCVVWCNAKDNFT